MKLAIFHPKAREAIHAFMKKTQKTPQREIEVGQRRLKEMLNEEK